MTKAEQGNTNQTTNLVYTVIRFGITHSPRKYHLSGKNLLVFICTFIFLIWQWKICQGFRTLQIWSIQAHHRWHYGRPCCQVDWMGNQWCWRGLLGMLFKLCIYSVHYQTFGPKLFCVIFSSLQLLANQWNRGWGDVSLWRISILSK